MCDVKGNLKKEKEMQIDYPLCHYAIDVIVFIC